MSLGTGLVQPRRISFIHCKATKHKSDCQCIGFLGALGIVQGLTAANSGDVDNVDIDEEFFKEMDGAVRGTLRGVRQTLRR